MTFAQLGDDLNALIEHLARGPVHLAGISDGGVMALDQALRRPATVRSLVLDRDELLRRREHTRRGRTRSTPTSSSGDHPDLAAKFAGDHDDGKHPGFWKELIGQIIDNNRVNPSWTLADLRRVP